VETVLAGLALNGTVWYRGWKSRQRESLVDRTLSMYGRAYATVLRTKSVCLSSVRNVLWLNGASQSKRYY